MGGRRVFVFFSLSCFLSLFLPPAKSPESLSKACPKIPKVPQSLPEGSPKAPHLAVLAPQSLPKAPQSLPRVPQTTPRLPQTPPDAPRAENHEKIVFRACKSAVRYAKTFNRHSENLVMYAKMGFRGCKSRVMYAKTQTRLLEASSHIDFDVKK